MQLNQIGLVPFKTVCVSFIFFHNCLPFSQRKKLMQITILPYTNILWVAKSNSNFQIFIENNSHLTCIRSQQINI